MNWLAGFLGIIRMMIVVEMKLPTRVSAESSVALAQAEEGAAERLLRAENKNKIQFNSFKIPKN